MVEQKAASMVVLKVESSVLRSVVVLGAPMADHWAFQLVVMMVVG